MLDADQMLTLAQTALRACPADAAEVAVQVDTTALTRFANNQIHQNVASETIEVRARAVVGERVGCASARGLDDQALLRVAQQAAAAARLAQARPDLPALPAPAPLPVVDGYVAATAECTPEERAALVSVVCERARARGLVAAGAAQTQVHALAVVNTRGVAAYACAASADLHAVVMAGEPTISGYAARAAADVRTLDATALAEEAIGRAERAHAPADLPEGDYEVVLEPYATADIVEMLAYLGFSARAYQEGTSFLCGRLGQQIVSEHVSIWDDALDPHGLPFPCDYEGVPKRRVALIERGVAHDVVYDTETGARAGRASTGHALPAPSTFGPMPLHLFMGTGDVASVEQFVAGVDRGVLVTRFWYTRPVHPRQVIVTGMTRDGTFLIEQGRVVGPVRNARYTQSYLAALSDMRGITRDAALLKGDMFGAHNVPALHLARWHFQVAT